MLWSIGMEVTLSVLGLSDVTLPTIGTAIFWANQHQALVAGVWWWLAAPISGGHHLVPRAVLALLERQRVHRSAHALALDWRLTDGTAECGKPPRLLSDRSIRHLADGARRGRRVLRAHAERDLWGGRRVELRQDDADQGDLRHDQAAAEGRGGERPLPVRLV